MYQSCRLADGSSAAFKGKVSVTVTIGSFESTVCFYMLPAAYNYAILGCNFLTSNNAVIDFTNNTIDLQGATINFIDDNESQERLIYTNIAKEFEDDYICDELPGDKLTRVTLQDNKCLTSAQKSQFIKMLHSRKDVFAETLTELGCCKNTICDIELKKDTAPIYVKPYKNSWAKRSAMQQQCEEWIGAGIIKENKNPKFNFPALMVPKKNSKKERLCINFQELNKHVAAEKHNAMTIDEFLMDFGSMKGRIFSVLDLGSAYLQIPLTENAQQICSFAIGHKNYSFLRVPFGYKNSGHMFGRAIASTLDPLLHKTVCNLFANRYSSVVHLFT